MLWSLHAKHLLLLSSFWLLASCSGDTSFNIGESSNTTDGDYEIIFELSDGSAAGSSCQELTGIYALEDSTLMGSVQSNYLISGTFNADNTIIGVILLESGDKLADFSGELEFGEFSGTWIDISGCTGSWTAYPS
jgi:hypothetical protein